MAPPKTKRAADGNGLNPLASPPSNPTNGTSDRATDFALLARSADGDPAAFRALVDRHQRKAHAVAYGLVRNVDDAREVVQEAFIRVYRHVSEFAGQASFGTWFYRIVVNLAIDHLRKRAPGAHLELSEDLDTQGSVDDWNARGAFDPSNALDRKRIVAAMQRALDALPVYHRAVIVLREVEGLSYQEMAESMGVSKGTIMSRLFHARRKMQGMLTESLGADAVPAVGTGDDTENVRGAAEHEEPDADGKQEEV